MQHFSCDLCGKDLTDSQVGRFVVRMEVFAAHDPEELSDDDLGTDHLEEMGEMLAETGDTELAPAYMKLRYDLCPICHKKFLADPLNREASKFDFSEN